ncbi:GNAT family N-acetyltransferase [Kitasatospora purpeofusca]|uniref:GNAT family N-acetyltransferase n=1 Tax=Kitasatospora purpeofusca TaxID=67352 RepID=UPI002A5991AB|nr:GNAT family N-acetyltransferase [Kitasatospora purpeofusca]MDY0813862.1 GNAT family N-acetyltransferase [Kitasatospora purpeofusca]
MTYRIERIGRTDTDWERMREVRLAQLLDTPMAFLETYGTALAHGDEEWHSRIRRVNEPGSVGLAAVHDDGAGAGEWVGTMIGFTPEPGTALLVGVWVHPEHRGRERGVTDTMLDAIIAWARETGARRLLLTVHEDNARAAAFYRRRGFEFTGGTKPYPLDPAARELEMALPLA